MSPEYCVPLPLKAITDLFPQELKSTLRKNPSEHVHVGIPRSLIEPQLAGGAVHITFAQLRAATPEIFFHPRGGADDAKIVIPLDAILRELMPARREDQREISIPGNIPSVFSKAGAPGQHRASASTEPWYSHRRPTYEGPGTEIPAEEPEPGLPIAADEAEKPLPAPEPAKAAAPAEPAPVAAPERFPRMPAIEHAAPAKPAPASPKPGAILGVPEVEPVKPVRPAAAAPEPLPASIVPIPGAEPAPASILPVPSSFLPIPAAEPAKPARPVRPEAPKPEAVSTVWEPPALKLEPRAPVVAEVPAAAAAPADTVSIALTTILPVLPAEIREAMNGLDPATRSFHIPLEDFESQMRSGRLRFKWSKLQGWCRPEPFAATAGDLDIDLPLAELVPLFMAKRKAPDGRKKFEIDARIPDVFGKSNIPAPAPTPAAEPAPEPAAEAVPAPAPEAVPSPAAEATPAPAAGPIQEPAPEAAAETTPEAPMAAAAAAEPPPAPVDEAAPVSDTTPEPVPFPAATLTARDPSPVIPAGPTITPFRVEQAPTVPVSGHPNGAPSNPSTQALGRIRALDGVSGAFLATADGLLIAADVPDGNENILAAFAPTVFAQLAKYCDMAELGAPVSIDLHLGLTNIHVRKAGKVFLGVLSADGRPLPLPELNLIAATLQPHAS